jgi:O-antigen/teichoic acid export membrane protein
MRLIRKYKSILKKYTASSMFKKISINMGWLFFDKILRLGVGLVVTAWVARYLGPADYGKWNYVIALVSIFGALATLGIEKIAIKRLVEDPHSSGVLLGSSFCLRILGGLATMLFSIIAVLILNSSNYLVLIITIIISSGYIFQAFDVIDYFFQSKVESKFTVYAKNTAFVMMSIMKIIFILKHADLLSFVWLSLIEMILGAIFMIGIYRWGENQQLRNWRVNKKLVKDLLSESWPLILTGLVIMIYMRIDQIMLGKIKGDTAVGIYSVAVKIAEVWYFIPLVVTSSVFPSLINAKKISNELFFKRLQNMYNILAGISIFVAMIVTLFSHFIIKLLFGLAYMDAASMLSLTVWAGVFVFLGSASSQYLIIEGFMKISFYRTSIGAFVNIILNLFLIPLYSGNGAAIATLIAYGISTFGIVLFKKSRNQGKLLLNSLIFKGFKGTA